MTSEQEEGPVTHRASQTSATAPQQGRGDSSAGGGHEVDQAWPEPEGGYKPVSKIGNPESAVFTTRELKAMNQRILARRQAVHTGHIVEITGPKWAEKIIDTGEEIVALHRDTLEPYPLDVQVDLDLEGHCVLVLSRVLRAGANEADCLRIVDAFGLPGYARTRLRREIREAR